MHTQLAFMTRFLKSEVRFESPRTSEWLAHVFVDPTIWILIRR